MPSRQIELCDIVDFIRDARRELERLSDAYAFEDETLHTLPERVDYPEGVARLIIHDTEYHKAARSRERWGVRCALERLEQAFEAKMGDRPLAPEIPTPLDPVGAKLRQNAEEMLRQAWPSAQEQREMAREAERERAWLETNDA